MNATPSKPQKKPSIYIDTMIARDITHRPKFRASLELLKRVRDEGWDCCISAFGIMELIDLDQEERYIRKRSSEHEDLDRVISTRKRRNLDAADFAESREYTESFLNEFPFVKVLPLDDANWRLAVFITTNSNLHAKDVIHLVTAEQADCDVLVTRDDFFIDEATRHLEERKSLYPQISTRLRVCKPEDCCRVLAELGYQDVS